MAQTGNYLSALYTGQGWYKKCAELAPKVIDLIERMPKELESFARTNLYCLHLGTYAFSLGMLGKFSDSEALFKKASLQASDIDDLLSLGWIEFCSGIVSLLKGEFQDAVKHYDKAIKYCEQTQNTVIMGLTFAQLSATHARLGNADTAREYIEKSLEIYQARGLPAVYLVYYFLGMAYLALGDLENAHKYAEQALKLSEEEHDTYWQGMCLGLLGRILGKSDKSQSKQAEEYIIQCNKIMDEHEVRPYVSQGYLNLGEFYADTGQGEKALEALKKAESAFQEMGMDYWLRRTQEVLDKIGN
jgi:tetratricopeptide (TPR) repeat protein